MRYCALFVLQLAYTISVSHSHVCMYVCCMYAVCGHYRVIQLTVHIETNVSRVISIAKPMDYTAAFI